MPVLKAAPANHCIDRFRSLHRSSCLTAYLIAAWALAPLASAANNPSAHEHGSARLQMALENNRIDLLFTSPAYNLAGFEHRARTASERNRLTEINQWLETNPLITTAASTCRVMDATVEHVGGEDSHTEHDHHDEHHHDDEATHRDYEVAQQLECEKVSGERFSTPLLSRFPELQELTIEWVSASGQGSARITSANGTFTPGE